LEPGICDEAAEFGSWEVFSEIVFAVFVFAVFVFVTVFFVVVFVATDFDLQTFSPGGTTFFLTINRPSVLSWPNNSSSLTYPKDVPLYLIVAAHAVQLRFGLPSCLYGSLLLTPPP
jgi:hypothetical protein